MTAGGQHDRDPPNRRVRRRAHARRSRPEAPVVAAHFLDGTAFFVLSEETLLAVPPEGEPRRVPVHSGGILGHRSDGERVLTAGDDGKVGRDQRHGRDPHHRHRSEAALDRPHRRRA